MFDADVSTVTFTWFSGVAPKGGDFRGGDIHGTVRRMVVMFFLAERYV